jgi:hypothetical protein
MIWYAIVFIASRSTGVIHEAARDREHLAVASCEAADLEAPFLRATDAELHHVAEVDVADG